jgi:hypothetical protein
VEEINKVNKVKKSLKKSILEFEPINARMCKVRKGSFITSQ